MEIQKNPEKFGKSSVFLICLKNAIQQQTVSVAEGFLSISNKSNCSWKPYIFQNVKFQRKRTAQVSPRKIRGYEMVAISKTRKDRFDQQSNLEKTKPPH